MKYLSGLLFILLVACNNQTTNHNVMNNTYSATSGFSEVNGLMMYYEIYGEGQPLLLIHGGGSTIQTSFEQLIPLLAKNRQLIAVELQAHGRTADRDSDLSFKQDADDISALLKNLGIGKADFLGFSNGGTTLLQLAIRHPDQVGKIITIAPLAKRSGVPDFFWEFMNNASLGNMPKQLQEGFLKVQPDSGKLQLMHDRDARRMVNFQDIPDDLIQSIKAPTLIVIGDKDVILPEHALQIHRLIPNSKLAIIPGGHGACIGEITTLNPDYKQGFVVDLFMEFLDG